MSSIPKRTCALIAVLAGLLIVPQLRFCAFAAAGTVNLATPGETFSLHVISLRERSLRTVVLQRYDYSCGAAAVATLLSYSYDRPTTEAQPFVQMITQGDRAKIEKVGFSLLDMKNYLKSLGYQVSGFQLSLPKLQEIRVPGIALIQTRGYKHFVVIRAVNDRSVLFADPARGMVILSRARFREMWDGVLLVIRSDLNLARAGFNEEAFVRVRPHAPMNVPLQQGTIGLSVFSQQLFARSLF